MYDSKPLFLWHRQKKKLRCAGTRLCQGTGKITINDRDIDDYFGLETLKLIVRQPLNLTDTAGQIRHRLHRCRRRRHRPGRRDPPRSCPALCSSTTRGASSRAEKSGLPDP